MTGKIKSSAVGSLVTGVRRLGIRPLCGDKLPESSVHHRYPNLRVAAAREHRGHEAVRWHPSGGTRDSGSRHRDRFGGQYPR